jgi:putative oxidoreductase
VLPRLGEQEENVFSQVAAFTAYSLLFLRVMVGLVFADSGYNDLKDPAARAASLGLPKSITVFLAVAELLGGLAVIFGVLTQLACIGLTLIMLGAIQKKIFVWKTGFWGKNGLGWNYELIFVSMLLVIFCTDGGRLTLLR